MLVIFAGSTDLLSAGNTSKFLVPMIRWFKPDASWRTIHRVQTIIRKAGHLTEYAILAVLTWRALRSETGGEAERDRFRRVVWIVLGVALLYAAADEFHQTFIPSRTGNAYDVLIDTAGAAIGLALIWCWGRWRRHW